MQKKGALAAVRSHWQQGAVKLAAFVEGLSEAEWRAPVSPTDNRSIGVIVHHGAAVYSIEIELTQAIASGKPVLDVTWELVAELNAEHFQRCPSIAKSAALELLRRNSHESAYAVRGFTDEQLDTAAPFSLSFGAPVTARFVMEEHALRHRWHHLAGVKKALGR